MLSVELESMEAGKAAGEQVDTLAYVAVLNAERRARSENGASQAEGPRKHHPTRCTIISRADTAKRREGREKRHDEPKSLGPRFSTVALVQP